MLSIKALKPGNESYYLSLALEDYYLQGGEAPGVWLGTGASILGLAGRVENDQLSNLFRGYSPNGAQPLVQNAGHSDRQSGWDHTFSVPKTVSVLWSAANHSVRAEIEAAESNALSRVMAYIEQYLAHSRVGKGGEGEVPARLIVAAFPHCTSRALEPHRHTHCLLINLGVGPDGRTRTIVSHPLYQNKMLLGALFRAELAYELLERLGTVLERESTWFEVQGIPTSLTREQSTRRRQIEEELGRLGLETATAAAFAALTTREVKEFVPPRGELFEKWKVLAKQHGLNQQAIELLIGRGKPPMPENVLPKATEEALRELASEHSHFSKADFLRALAEAPASLGVRVDALVAHTDKVLTWSRDIVCLGARNGETRYATREMLALEEQLLNTVHELHSAGFHTLSDTTVNAVAKKKRDFSKSQPIAKQRRSLTIGDAGRAARRALWRSKTVTSTLTHEQASAVAALTQRPRRICLLAGYAGTAKTTTLQAVREAYEAEGYKVIGATLSGKAATELSNRAGIPSTTVRMRELELNPSLARQLKHHGRQFIRSMRRWKTSKLERLVIDPKTVLVVDEASMIGTKDMVMLTKAVAKGGGKLILVGDPHQLPSIDAGGPFGSIAERIHAVHLRKIVRQVDDGDRAAVKAMPEGEPEKALAHYVAKGRVKVAETRSDLFAELIADWKRSRGAQHPDKNIICAALNREVTELNDLAQALRLEAGTIDSSKRISVSRKAGPHELSIKETFCVGDRVTFTKKSKKYRIENGDTGTLVAILRVPFANKISVLIDAETTPRIVPVKAVPIRRGYAFTTHKLQGATADNVFVAMTGPMLNRQMAYVQMSRHKHELNLYVPENLAEKNLLETIRRQGSAIAPAPTPANKSKNELRSVLSNLMTKDASKYLAHDVLENDIPARPSFRLNREQAERLLKTFAERNEVTVAKNTSVLFDQILTAWQEAGGPTQPGDHKIFAATACYRYALNRLAQKLRYELGYLNDMQSLTNTGELIFAGDHIRVESDLKELRIPAGTIATVVGVKGPTISIQCHGEAKPVAVPANLLHASLAYALPPKEMTVLMPKTAHVVVAGTSTDSELSYVYHSLHRERCRLYMTEKDAGECIHGSVKHSRQLSTRSNGIAPGHDRPKPVHKKKVSHA